ncbi:Hpt domain-containing protein [Magnetovibrio sp. PR-2]|uniref:Hpt domain-containing protein n=1 Tax=Magnetovibrio sp. PR-2 TaxID=3120356 RepID=UPI002FCE586C
MPDINTLRQLVHDVGPDTAQKLLEVFKDGSLKHLEAVRTHVTNAGELNDLRRHAHSLKGLCLTYGAVDGGKAAEVLQDACDAGDEAQIQAAAETALKLISKDIEETLAAFKTL